MSSKLQGSVSYRVQQMFVFPKIFPVCDDQNEVYVLGQRLVHLEFEPSQTKCLS